MAKRKPRIIGKTQEGNKIICEQDTRMKILAMARRLGGEDSVTEVKQILHKYDEALKKCTNEVERKHIGQVGAAELHRYFYCSGPLVLDGEVIIPGETSEDESCGKIKLA